MHSRIAFYRIGVFARENREDIISRARSLVFSEQGPRLGGGEKRFGGLRKFNAFVDNLIPERNPRSGYIHPH